MSTSLIKLPKSYVYIYWDWHVRVEISTETELKEEMRVTKVFRFFLFEKVKKKGHVKRHLKLVLHSNVSGVSTKLLTSTEFRHRNRVSIKACHSARLRNTCHMSMGGLPVFSSLQHRMNLTWFYRFKHAYSKQHGWNLRILC